MIKIKNVVVSLYNNIFVFSTVFFLLLGVAIYLLTGRSAVNMLIEQMLHREQAITRSGAGSIQSFLTLFGDAISLLAQNRQVSPDNVKESEEILTKILTNFKNTPMGGILLIDSYGELLLNPNIVGNMVTPGTMVDDREYYIWSKTAKEREVFWGEPILSQIGGSKGKMIIPISTPIIRDGRFKGVLAASIILPDLTKDFLDPLKISNNSEVYLFKDNGEIIYSGKFEETVDKNIFSLIDENKFLGSEYIKGEIKKALNSGKEGKLRIAYPTSNNTAILSERLLAYSPIDLGNGEVWYLVMSTPVMDALVFMGPFYTRQIILTILIFMAILIYAVRFSKMRGFKEGHDLYHKENSKE